MRKLYDKRVLFGVIVVSLVIFCFVLLNSSYKSNNNIGNYNQTETNNSNNSNTSNNGNNNSGNVNNESTKENIKEVKNSMKVIINNQEYEIKLEENKSVNALINVLPLEFDMTELNGNEKFHYIDYNLPTDSFIPKTIEKGDVMLYGENCIVVFYKTFSNSQFSYTKIGHIDNLPDLGNGNIKMTFTK